jgi:hypothetical protein
MLPLLMPNLMGRILQPTPKASSAPIRARKSDWIRKKLDGDPFRFIPICFFVQRFVSFENLKIRVFFRHIFRIYFLKIDSTWFVQGGFQQIGTFVLSTSKQIVESAMKNFFISRKAFCRVSSNGLLMVTLTLHEELKQLERGCGHGK